MRYDAPRIDSRAKLRSEDDGTVNPEQVHKNEENVGNRIS